MVFGLCGGLQMLGARLDDPLGLEGEGDGNSAAGLGLLPLHTRFVAAKSLRRRRSAAVWPAGPGAPLAIEGFELHHGDTRIATAEAGAATELALDPGLGWWRSWGEQGGMVAGSYLHGIFDCGPWRRRWLNLLRERRGLAPLAENQPHHSRQREALLERLADAFEAHVDLRPLLAG
jgi:adenosylcobyric acid synthase